MPPATHTIQIRVRYSETDQMGSYYYARPLEWFERGRVELIRALGLSYREIEERGVLLPVSEAHVQYLGRAPYDELLEVTSTLSMPGRARFRFDVEIVSTETRRPVCRGWTVHPVTDASGKPIRPPGWLVDAIKPAADTPAGS